MKKTFFSQLVFVYILPASWSRANENNLPLQVHVIKKTWSNLLDKQSQNTLVLVNILAWQLQFEQNPKTKYQENSVNLGTDGKKHGNCLNFWPTEKF